MPKKILIIEDESEIRRDLIKALCLSNYETISASDGLDGLKMAFKHKPDLIISDIMMPKLDGFSLLKELQKNPETASIPFLFLSAKSDRNDIRDGMKLGADDFITKPYDLDDLLQAIQIRLKKFDNNESLHNKKFQHLTTSIQKAIPHEVRTPLSIILGYSDYILKKFETISPKDTLEMVENIYNAAQRLNSLFEKYLTYSKLEHLSINKKELEKLKSKKTLITEIIIQDTAISLAQTYQREKDLDLKISNSAINLPEEYFTIIISELIDNAFKFSSKGSPVEIKSDKDTESYHLLIVDYGRGMSEEQIRELDAFIQFERKIYEQQGSGLGIAIVKKILNLFDCEMKINSFPHKYTKIYLRFPLTTADL